MVSYKFPIIGKQVTIATIHAVKKIALIVALSAYNSRTSSGPTILFITEL